MKKDLESGEDVKGSVFSGTYSSGRPLGDEGVKGPPVVIQSCGTCELESSNGREDLLLLRRPAETSAFSSADASIMRSSSREENAMMDDRRPREFSHDWLDFDTIIDVGRARR